MKSLPDIYNCKVSIVGLGYVGLPIAIEINKIKKCFISGKNINRNIVGFDIDQSRIEELNNGFDRTNEITYQELKNAKKVTFSTSESELLGSDVFIVTVPTPIDEFKNPYLNYVKRASSLVGKIISLSYKNNSSRSLPIVIFESTFYPGLTEEVCIPIIEKESKGKVNIDFLCGYSPERINPGDKERSIGKIIKLTSGMDEVTADWVDSFYASFIQAGTYKAESVKVAETAKVFENTQRDINIALVNELAVICRKLNIDTLDVLKAAGTKWNFLKFFPGLVGGHCIGVDPYYLTHRAKLEGINPEVVLAGRRINDQIGEWLIEQLISVLTSSGLVLKGSRFLILGITFKENCPDIRNSGILKLIKKIKSYGISVLVVDPYADKRELNTDEFEFDSEIPDQGNFDAVIAAVAHDPFKNLSEDILKRLISKKGKFLDIKGFLPRELHAIRL